jgi:hypothetical protein
MANNSARIAELRTILQAGIRSRTVDGASETYDLDRIAEELRKLESEDVAAQTKRPVASSIYLGGF